MQYTPIKVLLWLALGGSLAYAGLFGVQAISLGTVLVVAAALAGWLLNHREDIVEAHAVRKAKGEQYIRESSQPWRSAPSPVVVVGLLVVAGVASLLVVFSSPSASARGYLRQLLYSLIGNQGAVLIGAFAAAFFICSAVECGLGALWSDEA